MVYRVAGHKNRSFIVAGSGLAPEVLWDSAEVSFGVPYFVLWIRLERLSAFVLRGYPFEVGSTLSKGKRTPDIN